VSGDEALTHCLRNRYFYEKINSALQRNEIEVLINFGCGFSMYPYLLSEGLIHIEIDKPDVISHKQEKINSYLSDYKLPNRNVHYLSTDFSLNYELQLGHEIRTITEDRSTFILLEGVLFFLNQKETIRLFDFFSKIQNPNDFIGSVSYNESIRESKVFNRLVSFFKNEVASSDHFDYQILPDEFYENMDNYNLIDHQDYYNLINQYASEQSFQDEVLNEQLYLLKKRS
ncbi:MAG: adenosine deaminase, partial [Flavobacteriaceae bacterium]|nr:adenosine deaminase [Flavobacteriaceae bacterium]